MSDYLEVAFIIFGPPIGTWLFLASFPANRSYLIVLGFFAVIWGLIARSLFMTDTGNSPDNFFNGIEILSLFGALSAAVAVSCAQAIRWWRQRQNKEPYYLGTLFGVTISLALAGSILGSF